MKFEQEHIDSLVANPSESLSVEVKRWIDPATVEGQAKIIRGCFALRNRNGGYFVIGIDDKSLQPDNANKPNDPRSIFHVDTIQGLISKFAQELFEIGVAFSRRDSTDHPVIVVPSGVQVPVVAKRELVDSTSKKLIGLGDVYFRTLAASGVPSTSIARPLDWRDILDICFENREADIGRFLRRQLSGIDHSVLANTLRQLGVVDKVALSPPLPSLRDEANKLLNIGEAGFLKAIEKRPLDESTRSMVNGLTWHVALVMQPGWVERTADAQFLAQVLGSNPSLTSWPVWIDSRNFTDERSRPYRTSESWEALVAFRRGWSAHLDYFRLDPKGQLYLRKALQDDLSDKVRPGTALDPILVILRVAEAIAVGISVARSLSETSEVPHRLGFAFRWTKLAKRALIPWANPMYLMIGQSRSYEDEITTFVELPSDTPVSSIAPFVNKATEPLFSLFDGESIPSNVIEDWISKLVERRL